MIRSSKNAYLDVYLQEHTGPVTGLAVQGLQDGSLLLISTAGRPLGTLALP